MGNSNTLRKLTSNIVLTVILLICLVITSYALAVTSYRVLRENRFGTGNINIILEGPGDLDISLFEPGMTVEREYTIRNMSSIGVYFKVYFENVSGLLADAVDITLKEKNSGVVLYQGKASEFSENNINNKASEELGASDSRVLVISYHFSEDAGNNLMCTDLSFYIGAKAVQARNNADKSFD